MCLGVCAAAADAAAAAAATALTGTLSNLLWGGGVRAATANGA